jgi:hypothetical protein
MELSAAAAQAPAASAASPSSLADSLARIAGLFSAGMLTEAEFSAAKSAVLVLANPQPAAVVPAVAEAPVLLATVVAEPSAAEPVMAAAVVTVVTEQVNEVATGAAVPVERASAAVVENGVAPCGTQHKKRKRVRSHDRATKTPAIATSEYPTGTRALSIDRLAPQNQVWIRYDRDRCFYMAIVNEVSERGLTVTYPETYPGNAEWWEWTETINTADVTPERVRVTDPLADGATQQLENVALAPVAGGADTDPDWVPGTAGRRKAHTAHSGGTASKSTVSRFHGVSWHKSSRKWQAQLGHDGQKHFLGRFAEDKEEDAARAYDDEARRIRGAQAHGGRSSGTTRCYLNFPTEAEVAGATGAAGAHVGHTPRFHGVCWKQARSKWQAELNHDGKKHHLGSFAEDKQEDAARAYDTAARNMRGENAHGGRGSNGSLWKLNYPTPAEIASAARIAANNKDPDRVPSTAGRRIPQGAHVQGRYADGHWYDAVIDKVHDGGASYTVNWNDGDSQHRTLPAESIYYTLPRR